MRFQLEWKDPPARVSLDLSGVLRQLEAGRGRWALVRSCPSNNAARQLKRRVLLRLWRWKRDGDVEVRAAGCGLYMRCVR